MPASLDYKGFIRSPEFKALPQEKKRQAVQAYLGRYDRQGADLPQAQPEMGMGEFLRQSFVSGMGKTSLGHGAEAVTGQPLFQTPTGERQQQPVSQSPVRQFVGSAAETLGEVIADPLNLIPFGVVGKVIPKASAPIKGLLAGATGGAASSGVVDNLTQLAEIKRGERDQYDPWQTTKAVGMGLLAGAPLGAAGGYLARNRTAPAPVDPQPPKPLQLPPGPEPLALPPGKPQGLLAPPDPANHQSAIPTSPRLEPDVRQALPDGSPFLTDAEAAKMKENPLESMPKSRVSSLQRRIDAFDRAIDRVSNPDRRHRLIQERAKAIGELQKYSETLHEKAYRNEVTGLPNKRAMQERPQKAFITNIDLDDFKAINDELGHDVGDSYLRNFGDVLRSLFGDIFHASGDEFHTQHDTLEQAQDVARKIRDIFTGSERQLLKADGTVVVYKGGGVSVGFGRDFNEAEVSLRQNKASRTAAGERKGRGVQSGGIPEHGRAGGYAGFRQPEGDLQPPEQGQLSNESFSILREARRLLSDEEGGADLATALGKPLGKLASEATFMGTRAAGHVLGAAGKVAAPVGKFAGKAALGTIKAGDKVLEVAQIKRGWNLLNKLPIDAVAKMKPEWVRDGKLVAITDFARSIMDNPGGLRSLNATDPTARQFERWAKNAALINDVGVPPELKGIRDKVEMEVDANAHDAGKLLHYLNGLSEGADKAIFRAVTDSADPGKLTKATAKLREFVQSWGDEMERLGMISAESREWIGEGQYLKRIYEGKGPFDAAKSTVKRIAYTIQGIEDIVARGPEDRPVVPASDLHLYTSGQQKPKGASSPDGAKWGEWERWSDETGEWVRLRRDWTKAEREAMGEIESARMAFAVTLQSAQRNLKAGKLFEAIAKDDRWAKRATPTTGPTGKRMKEQPPEPYWVKLDGDRWGKLDGMYVAPEVASWLKQTQNMDMQVIRRLSRAVVRPFKVAKTVLNPPTGFANFMANTVPYMLKGGFPTDGIASLDGYIKGVQGKGDVHFNEADRLGVFNDDFVSREVASTINGPMPSAGEVGQAVQLMKGVKNWNDMYQVMAKSGRGGFAAMQTFYRAGDGVWRYALYKKLRADGLEAEAAAREAKDAFGDYSKISNPVVNALGDSFVPFIRYTYAMFPQLLKSAAERPHTAAYVLGLLHLVTNIARNPDREAAERENLRPYDKGKTLFPVIGPNKAMRLPDAAGELLGNAPGKPSYLSIARMMPIGDVFETSGADALGLLPSALTPSGPMMAPFNLAANTKSIMPKLNKDGSINEHMKQPITDPADSVLKRAADTAAYLAEHYVPSMATRDLPNLVSALNGQNDRMTPQEAALRILALRVVHPEAGSGSPKPPRAPQPPRPPVRP